MTRDQVSAATLVGVLLSSNPGSTSDISVYKSFVVLKEFA